jgi:hypothetical protein
MHVDVLGIAFMLNGQGAIGVHLENGVRTGEGVSQLRAQLVVVKQHDMVTDIVVVVEALIVFSLGIRDDLFSLTFEFGKQISLNANQVDHVSAKDQLAG